ncbi:MAG TPA: salicylate synthase [Nostocaceae cyanobacterium]|nr:salicylate synthase [Nostocaceae cyanobacterium]
MVIAVPSLIKYQETFIPSQKDPSIVLHNLLQAGVFSKYVMYQGENEVRIAGNELAKITVSQNLISLKGVDKSHSEPVSDPFKQVGELLEFLSIENWTAYGYISFDMVGFYSVYSKAIRQPLLYLLVPETELRITEEGVYIRSIESIDHIQKVLSIDSELPDYVPNSLKVNFADREIYQRRIEDLIAAIQQNKLHKAIISRSLKLNGDLDVLGTYVVGKKVNNSARSYCLNLEEVRAVGFSPEILMQVYNDGLLVTNPLAGTRPRGKTPEEDMQLHDQLFTDAKEVKEHSLSVWLAQSEIASLCLPGSVQVFNFMEVKKYRCVQHLSSRVGGQIKPGKTLWDALKVLFPGITVSGIDKGKALEWIDRLEDEPRGIYAGGIGWVDSFGKADLAIAIRSVYQYGSEIYLNAGAGIVAESVPENEYIESVNKMNTMLTNLVFN